MSRVNSLTNSSVGLPEGAFVEPASHGERPARSFLLLAGFADSIPGFRGDLIRALRSAGTQVHVAAPNLTRNSAVMNFIVKHGCFAHDLPLRRAGINPLVDLRLIAALVQLMRKIQPAILLGYTVKPVVYGSIAGWVAGVPRRYAMITGLGYAFTGPRNGVLRGIVRKLYRIALARTHKVFFQNPDDRRLFRATGILAAETPAVVINGSGIDVHTFGAYPLPADAISFLMIGRLLGDKGVREYTAAAERVRSLHPETKFGLVGWIDENPAAITRRELDKWVSDGTVEFYGKLVDVRPPIAASTVYVLPSYREGTPRTVLEAMAMGRPIITTDAPGCRETVSDGDNGFLVPVQSVDALVEAMLKFIEDPTLASRMGKRSREIAVEKYDVHKVNAAMLREMGIAAGPESNAGAV